MDNVAIKEEWFQAIRKLYSSNTPLCEKLQKLNLKEMRWSAIGDLESLLRDRLKGDACIEDEMKPFIDGGESQPCSTPPTALFASTNNRRGEICSTEMLCFEICSGVAEEDYLRLRWDAEECDDIAKDYSKHMDVLYSSMHAVYSPYKYNDEEVEVMPVGTLNQLPTVMYGRLVNEVEDRVNENSFALEGSMEYSYGALVSLIGLRELPKCCMFPGQTVAIIGTCTADAHASHLNVFRIYEGLPFSIPRSPPIELLQKTKLYNGGHITIGCTSAVNINTTLFKSLEEEHPNILILFGPIVDSQQYNENSRLHSDDIYVLYKKRFNTIIELSEKLKNTKVLVVPHIDDAIHGYPLPQPPFKMSSIHSTIKPPSNLHLMGNPSEFKVNDVHVCVTSCDPLYHISQHSVCKPEIHQKTLICQQLLQQRTLFPSYPTAYPVESKLLSKLMFNEVPNLFIFPSKIDTQPFVMKTQSRIFVSAYVPHENADKYLTSIEISPLNISTLETSIYNEEEAIQLDITSRTIVLTKQI